MKRRGKAPAAILPIEDIETLKDDIDVRLATKRRAAWERCGRKSISLAEITKMHAALARKGR